MTYSKTRVTKDHSTEYIVTPEVESIADSPAAPIRDRFAAPEYVNPNARLPRIQALRGENGASECGYFITETEMAKAGWGSIDETTMITYEYNSGGKERGLLIQSPRMLVVPRSPLFAFD